MESAPQYVHLAPGACPPTLQTSPTRVIVVLDQPVDPGWQHLVSRWLIEIGCLYMLAWGPTCSSWDDSVDMANLEAFDYAEIPAECNALTTWHADEPLYECMWFAKNCAVHSIVPLYRTSIIHIGPIARECELLRAYAEA